MIALLDTVVRGLGAAAAGVLEVLLASSWQVALLVAVVALIDRLLGERAAPEIRYGLWMLVALRLALPPQLPGVWTLVGSPALPGTIATEGIAAPALGPSAWSALASLWIAGTLVFAGVATWRHRRLRRRLLDASYPAPPTVLRLADDVGRALELNTPPEVRIGDGVAGPLATGCRRPLVVLPCGDLERWSKAELEHVLCHELAHVKRRDLWAEAAFAALNAVYWFHPLVWWARRRAATLRELCCDATAAQIAGPAYRHTLTRVAANMLVPPAGVGVAALGSGRSVMLLRLRQLERTETRPSLRPLARAAALTLIALVLLPLTTGRAASAPDTEAEAAGAREVLARSIDGTPGYGSLHARFSALRLNALEDRR